MGLHILTLLSNFVFIFFIMSASSQQIEEENVCLKHSGNLIIANPYDCHSFYACQHGNPTKIDCPNNLIFNSKLGNCDENYKDCIIDKNFKTDLMSEDINDAGEDETTVSENQSNTEVTTEATTHVLNSTTSQLTTSSPTSLPTSNTTPIVNTISTESSSNDCETCTKPTPPDACPSNDTKDPTFLPSDQFCDSFYLCYHGRPYELFCPRGFYWSQEYKKCVLERESDCTDSSSGNKAPKCPPNGQFFIPHMERCNLFYYCENGIRSVQQCAAFKQWDVVEQTCKLDISAKCIKTIPRSQRAQYYTL